MVQYCRKCGHELDDDAEFCASCGFNLNDRPTKEETKVVKTSDNDSDNVKSDKNEFINAIINLTSPSKLLMYLFHTSKKYYSN